MPNRGVMHIPPTTICKHHHYHCQPQFKHPFNYQQTSSAKKQQSQNFAASQKLNEAKNNIIIVLPLNRIFLSTRILLQKCQKLCW